MNAPQCFVLYNLILIGQICHVYFRWDTFCDSFVIVTSLRLLVIMFVYIWNTTSIFMCFVQSQNHFTTGLQLLWIFEFVYLIMRIFT